MHRLVVKVQNSHSFLQLCTDVNTVASRYLDPDYLDPITLSNQCLSPVYFPNIFIVFQLRMSQTSFKSTLQLSRLSFFSPYIFHSFYYCVSRTGIHDGKKKNRKRNAVPGLLIKDYY